LAEFGGEVFGNAFDFDFGGVLLVLRGEHALLIPFGELSTAGFATTMPDAARCLLVDTISTTQDK